MKLIKIAALVAFTALSVAAQAATRNVALTIVPPASGTPVGGYTLTRQTANATPQTLMTGPNTTFTDTGAVVGATYTYSAVTNGTPCPVITTTSTTTATATPAPCGASSTVVSITVTIPAGTQPAAGLTLATQ